VKLDTTTTQLCADFPNVVA